MMAWLGFPAIVTGFGMARGCAGSAIWRAQRSLFRKNGGFMV